MPTYLDHLDGDNIWGMTESIHFPQSNTNSTDIGENIQKRRYVFNPSEFTKQNHQISIENSDTTFERMKNNPQQWLEYHQNLEEAISLLGINPCEEIIKRLKQFPNYYRIGDFGCGKS